MRRAQLQSDARVLPPQKATSKRKKEKKNYKKTTRVRAAAVFARDRSHTLTIRVDVMESPTCFTRPSVSLRLPLFFSLSTPAANQHLKGCFDTEKESDGGGGRGGGGGGSGVGVNGKKKRKA